MKDGYDHQLKAEADKFSIARQQLAEKSAQVEQGQVQLKLMHEHAIQELSAAKQKHSLDNSRIVELSNHLATAKFEHEALQRFNQTSGEERYAVLSQDHRMLIDQSHTAGEQHRLMNTQLEFTVGSLKVSNEHLLSQVRENDRVHGQISSEAQTLRAEHLRVYAACEASETECSL